MRGLKFFTWISFITLVLFDPKQPNSHGDAWLAPHVLQCWIRCVFLGVSHGSPQGQALCSPILGILSLCPQPLLQNNHVRQVTHGEGCISRGQLRPCGKGAGPHCYPILKVLNLCLHYCRTTTFGREGLVSWGQPRLLIQGDRAAVLSNFVFFSLYAYSLSATPSIPWGVAPADPNFRSSPTYAYTVWPRVTQFSVVTHIGGASWWCL